MRLGETNPELRRIPIRILTLDGTLASSVDTLSPPPTVLVARNDGTLVSADGLLGHVSNEPRLHFYEASAAEALTQGFLLVIVTHSTIQTAIEDDFVGSTFQAGETDPAKLRLPLTIYDLGSPQTLVTGVVATGSQLQSSLDGEAFADDAGSLVEIGLGAYYWQAVPAVAASVRKAYVRVSVPGTDVALAWVDVVEGVPSDVAQLPEITLPPGLAVSASASVATATTEARVIVTIPTAINTCLIAAENITDNLRAQQPSDLELPSLYKRAFFVAYVTDEIALVRR